MIYIELFWTFFKIGLFTFGGGYAMLPLIQAETAAHGWMGNAELVNFIAVSESTPGPFAINISTYVGVETRGILGAFYATAGVVLPSYLIILIVAEFFEQFRHHKIVSGCMSGLKPAVIGLIGASVISVGKTVFFPAGISAQVFSGPVFYISLGIFALLFLLSLKKVHPVAIIALSAGIGIAVGYFFRLPV